MSTVSTTTTPAGRTTAPRTTAPRTTAPRTKAPATTAPTTAAARTVRFSFIDSPIGELLVSGERGEAGMNITGLYIPGHDRRPGADWIRDDGAFGELRRQLAEYFAGERRDFDLRAEAPGTPFQRRVWAELRRIDYGRTASYGEVALAIGAPSASRAVGGANGRNPISVIVPCHRVVGSNGKLTGYAGGVTAKSWLLEHERRRLCLDGVGSLDGGATDSPVQLPFPA